MLIVLTEKQGLNKGPERDSLALAMSPHIAPWDHAEAGSVQIQNAPALSPGGFQAWGPLGRCPSAMASQGTRVIITAEANQVQQARAARAQPRLMDLWGISLSQ